MRRSVYVVWDKDGNIHDITKTNGDAYDITRTRDDLSYSEHIIEDVAALSNTRMAVSLPSELEAKVFPRGDIKPQYPYLNLTMKEAVIRLLICTKSEDITTSVYLSAPVSISKVSKFLDQVETMRKELGYKLFVTECTMKELCLVPK
jgi:hypothetical protein